MYTGSGTSGSGEPRAPIYDQAPVASAPPPNYTNPPPPQYNEAPPSYGGEGQPGQQPINNFQHPPPTGGYTNPPPPNQGYQQPPNQGYQQPPNQNYNQGYQPPNQVYLPSNQGVQPIQQHTYIQPTQTNSTGPPAGRPKYSALTDQPVKTTCRNCNEYVTTVVDSGPDCGTCAVCCLVSLCLCPVCGIAACCWPRTWGHTHKCPKCQYIMGTKDAFGPHYTHNKR